MKENNKKKGVLNEKPYTSFCSRCQKHLYKEIELFHRGHKRVPLHNININEIKSSVINSHIYLDNHFNSIYSTFITQLETELRQLKITYESNYNRNKDILDMIDILIDTYSSENPNYYTEKSLELNTNFNYSQFNFSGNYLDNLEQVKNYMNNFTIIQPSLEEINCTSSLKMTKEIRISSENECDIRVIDKNRIYILYQFNYSYKDSVYNLETDTFTTNPIKGYNPIFLPNETILSTNCSFANCELYFWEKRGNVYKNTETISYKIDEEDIEHYIKYTIQWDQRKVLVISSVEIKVITFKPLKEIYSIPIKEGERNELHNAIKISNKDYCVILFTNSILEFVNLSLKQIECKMKLPIKNKCNQQFTIKEISNNRIIISGDTNVILIIDIIIYQIITKINCDYDWQYQTFIFTDDLGIIADKLLNLNTTFIIRRDDSCFYGYNKKMIKLSKNKFIIYYYSNLFDKIQIWEY